jgi:hypothetical protein
MCSLTKTTLKYSGPNCPNFSDPGEEDYNQTTGVLRLLASVDVLPDEICQFYLNSSLEKDVIVRPQVICIANLKPWKTQIWKEQGRHVIIST